MSASAGEGARKLGERLLAEVEEEDLSSVSLDAAKLCERRIADDPR